MEKVSFSSEQMAEIKALVEENLRYTKTLSQTGQTGEALKLQQELQRLLQDNLKISQELYEMTKKIKQWVAWQKVWGVVKILIIIVPLVLGIIYLPSLLEQAFQPYQELLNLPKSNQNQNLIQQLESLIKPKTNAEAAE